MSDDTQAGWHPDPLGQHRVRWWDGQAWTDRVGDGPGSGSPEPAAPSMTAPLAHGAPPPPTAGGHHASPPPMAWTPAQAGGPDAEAIRWAQLSHLLCLLGYVLFVVYIAIPLAILFTRGKESEFVATHAKEAFNFTVSILIYLVIAGLSIFILIGWLLVPAIIVFDIVNIFRATAAAGRGAPFRYPLCIRFIR